MPKFSRRQRNCFVEERNIVRVYNLASKTSRTILPEGRNHSYSDGDFGFNWAMIANGFWMIWEFNATIPR
jgi:hypothetical protein